LHRESFETSVKTGKAKNPGRKELIPKIALAPSDASLPFTLRRVQFPIRLSYSMTINKSQGQTFENIGIYLPAPVFSHGQLYVAFSRARSFANIHIKLEQTSQQGIFNGCHITQNVVFKEIL
jgi:ATP-dependent exoDNAse (exonuclease V) alpha subunit